MAESPIQSSFIPRDAAAPVVSKQQRGGLYDLLMLISIVLFIASAALAVGVFLYVEFLKSESAAKVEQLKRAQAAFEPSLIQKLTRLDDRMRSADDLLSKHTSPGAIFALLEQTTLKTVAFRSFDLKAGDKDDIIITLDGVAQSVNSIALQADLFAKSTIIVNPLFSGIARQTDGVNFNVSARVKPSSIRYSSFAAAALGTIEQPAQQPSSPFAGVPGGQGAVPSQQTVPANTGGSLPKTGN